MPHYYVGVDHGLATEGQKAAVLAALDSWPGDRIVFTIAFFAEGAESDGCIIATVGPIHGFIVRHRRRGPTLWLDIGIDELELYAGASDLVADLADKGVHRND